MSMLTTKDKLLVVAIIIGGVLGIVFLFNIFLTKMIIWVLLGFGVDCTAKFWYVFVGLMLFQTFFGGFKISKK